MNIAIVRYNAGNVQSVTYALNRLGVNPLVTDDPVELQRADKVIFPGVGEASTAMTYLKQKNLDKVIVDLRQPFLGICLGLQLMCRHSEENDTQCLGIFNIEVKRFTVARKVPQIGWNRLENTRGRLFDGIAGEMYTYFVHSYFAEVSEDTIATASYGETFSAALHRDNFYAIQPHPEKSGHVGEKILKNFLSL